MKMCANCFKTKSLDEFYRRRKDSEARQWWCKECHNEIHRAYKKRKFQKDFTAWVKGEK